MIKYYYKEQNKNFVELSTPQKGCWINVYPPSNREELKKISEELNIDIDFLMDSLDIDERSRYEQEDNVQFIVLNSPIKNESVQETEALYITVPLGIVEVDDYILTISRFKNPVIEFFLSKNIKELDTRLHSHFVLLLFDKTVHYFLFYLRNLNSQLNNYEKELYNSSRNKELFKLMTIHKSLVYFVTTTRDNHLMMLKMKRIDFLNLKNKPEELSDSFEDIIVDMRQAYEVSQIYTDILNGTLDTFASIISNNLNTVMKRLTSITIILMLPTVIFSFFGMNIPLFIEKNYFAMPLIILITVICTALVVLLFRKQKLF